MNKNMDYTLEFVDARTGKPLKGKPVGRTWYGITEEQVHWLAIGHCMALHTKYERPAVIVHDTTGRIVERIN